MFQEGAIVLDKDTQEEFTVDSKEWENGWCYTLQRKDGSFAYRTENELINKEEMLFYASRGCSKNNVVAFIRNW